MKKYNFNAGPSILPREVIEATAQQILDFNGSGLSLMEISHRAKDFQPVVDEAVALIKEILDIPEGYSVIFLGGGASLEFCMVPYNFLEKKAAYLNTALGQNIYTQESQPNGHYNHLDTINCVRNSGSIATFLKEKQIEDGIIYNCEKYGIPYVLAGSIRDDGPLPGVIGNAYEAQERMREQVKDATTVLCMATMLHSIAVGNMTPSFRVMPDGTVREIYFYCVDISEFTANKLSDRGSLSARGIVTNVQDFIVTLTRGLGL